MNVWPVKPGKDADKKFPWIYVIINIAARITKVYSKIFGFLITFLQKRSKTNNTRNVATVQPTNTASKIGKTFGTLNQKSSGLFANNEIGSKIKNMKLAVKLNKKIESIGLVFTLLL